MSDMPITRRNLAIRTGALALTGLLPSLAKAEEALPVVYYAREATPEAFLAIFDKLREDLGAVGRKGLVGLKLHGDEVDKNRALEGAAGTCAGEPLHRMQLGLGLHVGARNHGRQLRRDRLEGHRA